MTQWGQSASREWADDLCEHAGHEWMDAGGLEMCGYCFAERWASDEGTVGAESEPTSRGLSDG